MSCCVCNKNKRSIADIHLETTIADGDVEEESTWETVGSWSSCVDVEVPLLVVVPFPSFPSSSLAAGSTNKSCRKKPQDKELVDLKALCQEALFTDWLFPVTIHVRTKADFPFCRRRMETITSPFCFL
jgi:hypothetical protein